jgi:hypothetical protein
MTISDTLSLDAPYAAFVVYNNTAAPGSPHRALQGRDNNWFLGLDSSFLSYFAGGFVANSIPTNPNQFYIAGANNFNLFSFYRLDGVDQTDSAGFVGFPGRLGLGAIGVSADPLAGDVAEVIVYHHGLNTARMTIVENYLSAKYDISIPGTIDYYDGDTPLETHFDLDVAGIGLEADGDNDNAHSRGIIVIDEMYLQNNGDYLLFGHKSITNNDGNPADHPNTIEWNTAIDPVIWERHWYFDRTDIAANGGTVTIAFDFSEGDRPGTPSGPTSNYRLLERPNATGQFNDITASCTTATSFNGDQVVFSGVDVTCLGSNFTLGSLDNTTSPTAITFQSVQLGDTGNTMSLLALALMLILGLFTVGSLRRVRKAAV